MAISKVSFRLDFYPQTWLPMCMACAWTAFSCLALSAMEGMQLLSYAALFAMLVSSVWMIVKVFYKGKIDRYVFCHLLFAMMLLGLTIVGANDLKNAVYQSLSLILVLFLIYHYRNNLKFILPALTAAFSLCIYVNFVHMMLHPMMWMLEDDRDISGFLLGGNYNQMGCRILLSWVLNMLVIRYSRLWILNMIVLVGIGIATLAIVQSMTSLSVICVFLLYLLVPSVRLKRMGIYGFFAIFLIFQFFVVFSGKGIENNSLARYIVEDVLNKDITFTNRTFLWDASLDKIAESPIIGYGIVDADWYVSKLTSVAIGPHNFLLNVLVNGGVALFGLLMVIYYFAISTINRYREVMALNILFAIACLFVMMLMEVYSYNIVFLLLALAYYYPEYRKQTMKDGNE